MVDRLDVCVCGDYRHQHDERGRCKLNGLGHGGAEDCNQFTLFLTAREVLIIRANAELNSELKAGAERFLDAMASPVSSQD